MSSWDFGFSCRELELEVLLSVNGDDDSVGGSGRNSSRGE